MLLREVHYGCGFDEARIELQAHARAGFVLVRKGSLRRAERPPLRAARRSGKV
jgi:hypothetical protein